jgi:hypothetical protein
MLIINDKEKELIIDNYDEKEDIGFVNLRGKEYFIKCVKSIETFGTELIVKRAAHLVGINAAHYELANIDNTFYYLSQNLNSEGMFRKASEVIGDEYDHEFSVDSLYYIWYRLSYLYPDKCEYLMNQIAKLYLFDIIMIQDDRHDDNWGFLFNGDNINVWIYDNEFGLLESKDNARMSSLYYGMDDYRGDYIDYRASNVEKNNNGININKNLYLETFAKNYREIGTLLNKTWGRL